MAHAPFLSLAVMMAFIAATSFAAEWSYSDKSTWKEQCSNGKRQSPINIYRESVDFDKNLAYDPIKFTGYSGQRSVSMLNNGHTLVLSLAETTFPKISGGNLARNHNYMLAQMHFHWGNSTTKGSEHLIDNKAAPLEVHFVHYNDKYGSLVEAMNETDGLAVIGFLFEVAKSKDTAKSADYSDLTPVIAKFAKDPSITNETFMIELGKLVPKFAQDNTGIFFRYEGSLTTPPCYESVTWTVYENRIPIDEKLLNEFAKVKYASKDNHAHHDGHDMNAEAVELANNYREFQPLNGRKVTTNMNKAMKSLQSKTASSGAAGLVPSLFVLLAAAVKCVIA